LLRAIGIYKQLSHLLLKYKIVILYFYESMRYINSIDYRTIREYLKRDSDSIDYL